ncbi:potassium transporter Kup [Rubellimicrobium aerolatum]|uniref:Probable potassium transport system protein Kup n=1 Tax=Rubellimicrobium aerolatum TaxID=490979 RepID=A0ABW0S9P1_9RHOB|nr:potassium transporter Kup [Rubellimicrobium aerolatum]MBP1805026.1 KUP system potassium uptake protein [Rubellimicrobium aerolatum]
MSDSDRPDAGATGPAVPRGEGQSMGEALSAAHTPSDLPTPGQHGTGSLAALTMGAIGVVYGDIGTSPLYAMRESLHAASRDGLTDADVIGVISLLIWTLVLIVTFKYVVLILRADNRGEGGTLSLVALVQGALDRRPVWLLGLGMVGVSLFFGDAIITPAMSVLSAVEGMRLVTPAFTPYVVPITLAIITGLFVVQRWGTGAVSVLFGPIMAAWFLIMGLLGLMHIDDDWSILRALNPGYAAGFVVANGLASLLVLGSVFLSVTGAEALYADLGHFGRRPIRVAWVALVWPALTLSYLGQGALVLSHPETASNPFFLMAPDWALLPLVILATAATVIASQAVISGAFSMVKQAVRMGLLPRLEILHTSESQEGQIYLPRVNAVLAVGVIILVLVFESSSNLAAAYGIAVTGDMVITTILATFVMLRAWRWNPALVSAIIVPILAIEAIFLGANILKIPDGGWVPILMSVAMILLMYTWVRGTRHVQAQARRGATSIESLIEMLAKSSRLKEVPGTAIFLTSDPDIAPAALMHNIKHNHVLHERNIIVCVSVATRPFVPDADRVRIIRLSERFSRVDLCFGYMEETNVPRALALARKQGEKFDIMSTSFFLNRRTFRPSKTQGLPGWQESLFIAMTKSAANATDFYRIPTNRVIELGQQIII